MIWIAAVATGLIGVLLVALGCLLGHRHGMERGRAVALSRLILEARCSCCGDREWSKQDGAVLEAGECKT